jgi:hypothetical protein
LANKDLLAQLLELGTELDLAVATQIDVGETDTACGTSPGYPQPAKLVTERPHASG